GLERLVARIVMIEGKVVAEDDEAVRALPHEAEAGGQRVYVLAMNFDEFQPPLGGGLGHLLRDLGVRSLDERGLAHTARTPEQGIVGGKSLGEAARVLEELVRSHFDALEQG